MEETKFAFIQIRATPLFKEAIQQLALTRGTDMSELIVRSLVKTNGKQLKRILKQIQEERVQAEAERLMLSEAEHDA